MRSLSDPVRFPKAGPSRDISLPCRGSRRVSVRPASASAKMQRHLAVLWSAVTSEVRFEGSLSSPFNTESRLPCICNSTGSDRHNPRPGAWLRCHLEPLHPSDTSDLSCSQGTTIEVGMVLRPRPSTIVRPYNDHTRPVGRLTSRTRDTDISGLNSHTLLNAVYASQSPSRNAHARLATGCRPALPGGIDPQGSTEGFWLLHVSIPPSQS